MRLSVSNKRQHDENLQELIVRKKRKPNPANLNGFEDTSSVVDPVKMPNQRPVRSCRMNNKKPCGDTDSLNPSNARVKRLNIKSCDNSDIDYDTKKLANYCKVLRRTKSGRNNEMNLPEKTNFVTRQGAVRDDKLHPANVRVSRRSLPSKNRITQKHVEEVCAQKIEKRRGRSLSTNQRKSLPLTTSTTYNTRRNNQVIPETPLNRRYNLRRYGPLSIESSIVEKIMPEKKTVTDKTVIDHSKRFSKSNSTTTVKKCDPRNRIVKSQVQHDKKTLQKKQKITNKLSVELVEITKERLASKKHVDKEKSTKREAPTKEITDKSFVKIQKKKKLVSKKHVDKEKPTRGIAPVKKITDKSLDEISEEELVLKKYAAEEKPTKDLIPMTEKMIGEIKKILSSGKRPLVQIKDAAIELQDINTLQEFRWLDDKIINAYMNLIKIRSEKDQENYPKVHCFNSFFYWQLLSRGYNSVQRWSKNVDVFDYAVIIIPIHLDNHWCLIEIRMKDRVIKYYDSLGKQNNRCLKTMLQYLTSEHKEKKGEQLNVSRWKIINVPRSEIPIQKNQYDCGVFACTYAEHIARNASFNFLQEDMKYFRRKITYEILTGHLLL